MKLDITDRSFAQVMVAEREAPGGGGQGLGERRSHQKDPRRTGRNMDVSQKNKDSRLQ